ncbi:hypothetical protein GY21_11305 [Cryobacterium roopkundense]|uniref:Uncharacterized protein n=1 Tax=Cryobacterium roopkundense TaxID=1001240 RepID=A0A099J7G0_9MICO|nr:hypothetical protein GY21_11305 [Cryobacterium roopkundense]MBB5640486.1 hypothetical protein [Cryobacterium roopkundense]
MALSQQIPVYPIDRVMPFFAAKTVICSDAYCVPRSELYRIRLNSDYAEDDVKPRNRADAKCPLGTTFILSA